MRLQRKRLLAALAAMARLTPTHQAVAAAAVAVPPLLALTFPPTFFPAEMGALDQVALLAALAEQQGITETLERTDQAAAVAAAVWPETVALLALAVLASNTK